MLNDTFIKSLKPKDKIYRHSDGNNLLIKIAPSGTKTFEIEYKSPISDKIIRKAIGKYPFISLARARQILAEYKTNLANGIDPAMASLDYTFNQVASRYMATKSANSSDHKRLAMLLRAFNDMDIAKITPQHIIVFLKQLEAVNKLETMNRAFRLLSGIFKSASEYCANPCDKINYSYTFKKHIARNYPTLTDPKDIKTLLISINEYIGEAKTAIALKLVIYTALRPGNIRNLVWEEVDLDNGLIAIKASKMKMKRDFILPLSKQAIKLLKDNRLFLGDYYLFSEGSKVMSENTLNSALRRMGYSKEQIVSHGFRAMFSTICHENGKDSRIIEKCLAHADSNQIRAVYNRSTDIAAMRELMQWWSDYLDNLL